MPKIWVRRVRPGTRAVMVVEPRNDCVETVVLLLGVGEFRKGLNLVHGSTVKILSCRWSSVMEKRLEHNGKFYWIRLRVLVVWVWRNTNILDLSVWLHWHRTVQK